MDMDMGSAVPEWLTPVAWAYIALALLTALVVAADIYLGRRRHGDALAELVWITSGLYLGPAALPLYRARGRAQQADPAGTTTGAEVRTDDPLVAVLPGGSASAVAHLLAVPFVLAVGWTIAGLDMWPMIIVIAVLATVMLTAFERRAGRSTRRPTLAAALVAAGVTVAAFDVGMVGWMLVLHLNDAMPAATEGTFWFLMQVGVLIGLATGYPAVRWLLRRGAPLAPA